MKIGTAGTLKGAKERAKEFSLKGLGASTFIKKGGKVLDVPLGEGFRRSKQDRKIQVQKKSLRLGTFGERMEILKSRRRPTLFKKISSKNKKRWF